MIAAPEWDRLLDDAQSAREVAVEARAYTRSFPTLSKPVLLRGENGREYVVKGSQGGRSLFNEQVVARLGHAVVPAWVVPGSEGVKRQAEAEGLDRVFIEAGFEWRAAGCSLCTALNGDQLQPGERCGSTSNRNFQGRQGPGGRTHLMSPAMAAAAALYGHLVDVRQLDAGK